MRLFITPNDTLGNCDSESIQNAVDTAIAEGINKVVIPRMNARTGEAKWVIDTTVRLPSDMLVVLDNCYMQMADEVVGGFFCSDNLFTERATSLAHRMHGIHIKGEGHAVLDGGRHTGLTEATQNDIGIPVRLNSPIFFINVEGFSIENIEILNHRYWGIRLQFCARGTVRDIHFECNKDRRNQDGIDLRNGCNHILIENVHGQSGDDMIALSAIDRKGTGGFYDTHPVLVDGHDWDIHDVTIRNVSGSAITHPLIALRNHNGAKMYNIVIDNVRDTEQLYPCVPEYDGLARYALVHIGQNWYYETEQQMGDTYNISVSNLFCNHCDAAVLVGSTLRNSRISNVYGGGSCKTALTVVGDNWGDDTYGVRLENVTLDGVFIDCADKARGMLLNFSYMREGDYVRCLRLENVNARGLGAFCTVNRKCTELDIRLGECNFEDCCLETVRVSPVEITRAEKFNNEIYKWRKY